MNYNLVFFLVLFILISFSCNVDKSSLAGHDFRLFKDTPVWSLAKLVESQDTSEFVMMLKGNSIDYPDPIFGSTLLEFSVLNGLDKSVEKLLELKADTNHTDLANGNSAMHDAVAVNVGGPDTTILSNLIKAGGDVNGLTSITQWVYHSGLQRSVLYIMTEYNAENLEVFDFLIRNGANVNQKLDGNLNLLNKSIELKNYKLTYFLLKNGMEFREPIFTRLSGKEMYIQDVMKEDIIDLDSDNYQDKLKVIDFIIDHGIDYRGTLPPSRLVKRVKRLYPNSWQNYLSKY